VRPLGAALALALPACVPSPELREETTEEPDVEAGEVDPASIQQVVGGGAHLCVRRTSGRVQCWGSGLATGRAGDPIGDDETPEQVDDVALGAAAEQIEGGYRHTCAIVAGGAVRCWGEGGDGQLGYGDLADVGDDETPAERGDLPLGGAAVQLAGGAYHTCALLSTGRVRCWGRNGEGQLGYGHRDTFSRPPPFDVDLGGVRATAIAAGDWHTCALLIDETVSCWGDGADGRLGYGDTQNIGDDEVPGARRVDVGGAVGELTAGVGHSCALLASGRIRCWGNNADGRLGLGRPGDQHVGDDERPASVPPIELGDTAHEVKAYGRTCAALDGGDLRCWGNDDFGSLGHGQPEVGHLGDDELPTAVPPLALRGTVLRIGMGTEHLCAVVEVAAGRGGLRCWGRNDVGQLGYGDRRNRGDAGQVGFVPIGPDG
jgi:alpha-tubulin suppressor-like RCC1 family protein